MINRSEFEGKLQNIFTTFAAKRRFVNSFNNLMLSNHNVTAGVSNAYLFGNNKLSDATVEELYWLAQSVKYVLHEDIEMEKYFTSHEETAYAKSKKRNDNEDIYPIIFDNVMQVKNDQWVCVTDVNMLYTLYEKQLINYNYNTQRPATVREKDGITEYKITVNQSSVNEIKKLMAEDLFIPNAITLNVNMDNAECDFEYKDGEFTLFSGAFDISDGFHRYLAMMKNKMENSSFNYPCIINITNFDEQKACNFIAQESKVNRIKKSIVKTMDSTNLTNLIIQRLNEDTRCYLAGQIGRNATDKINSIDLFEIIDYCFKTKDRKEIVDIVKYLREIFHTIIEDNLFATDFITLAIIVRYAELYKDKENYIEQIENALNNKHNISTERARKHKMTKILVKEIDNLVGSVE